MTTLIYRKLDSNGDYTFGQGSNNFLVDSPAAVAQAIQTRLKLFKGEWFIDTSAGTPYNSQILGTGTIGTYNQTIQAVILKTSGVKSILAYGSAINTTTRAVEINCTVDTIYGIATLASTL